MHNALRPIGIGLVLLALFCATSLYAQKKGITIYGTYSVNGGDQSGVQIRLLRNGSKERNSIISNGKFEYNLQFNNQYELSFSKTGYITKKVVVSTDVPERVLKSNSNFPPFKVEVELFRAVEGGDYSIFDEPVALVIYDKELDDFDFDKAYNAEIEEQIKEAEKKIVEAPAVPKVDESSRLYEELIKKADREFSAKSYVNARKTYQEALEAKPQEKYPPIRIELIDKILEGLAKREKQKEQNDAYYALVDKAAIFFDEKKYLQARSYYVKASAIKADQQYPKDCIKRIDQIISQRDAEQREYANTVALGDNYFQEKKYKLSHAAYTKAVAMRKDESYPKEQIKRIARLLADKQEEKERKNAYNSAITKADGFFQDKNWFDAQDFYEKALLIFPEKRYPKDKIAEIEKLLKAKKESLNQYTEAINRADAFFAKAYWKEAREYYERALEVKPEEVYPKAQVEKIKAKLLAKELAKKQAHKAKEQAALRKTYDKAIAMADKELADKRYSFAKQGYRKALRIFPDEQYPKQKLAEIAARFQQQKEAERQYYKVLSVKDTTTHRYYKRIVPKEETKQRFVNTIDATQLNETKYEALMHKAQQEEAAGNISFAKAYYKQAYLEKPSLQLLTKLKELDKQTTQTSEKKE